MASFRLGHDELRHELPWRLMRNGPVTKYWRREYLDEDLGELRKAGFDSVRLDCGAWRDNDAMHDALSLEFRLPDYYGRNWAALNDSLTDIEVSENGGVVVVLDNFTGGGELEMLLEVLASASRWWLLFGRVFAIVLRTDDPTYRGPAALGATPPEWNGREWLDANR